ncbi:MAG: YcnI family protein [Frankiaceae bacterium]|nr:YcnI family protein [Frankiaceae bacterium]
MPRRVGIGVGVGLIALLTLAVALLLAAPSASAHVTVGGDGATQGADDDQITFTVPGESATAKTVKLTVQFPPDAPIATARTLAAPGWTAAIATQTLPAPVRIDGRDITTAIGSITWTADPGVGIGVTQYQTFTFSGAPLPIADTITFAVQQFYDDGTEVDWSDIPAPGSTAEPDHPAPVLSLDPAPPDSPGSGSTDSPGSGATASSASSARPIAFAALAVGILAALLAAGALVLARRRP